jgi:heterodisulfide reductase subunit A2
MSATVFFCRCGGNVSDRVDAGEVARAVAGRGRVVEVDFLCSEEGRQSMREELARHPATAVVAAACSPREHERTFQGVLAGCGLNPYLLQVVNIREQVAWVTEDPVAATRKAVRAISAGLARVAEQVPLASRHVEACPDVAVIGAGPAGLTCALALAEAGRQVTLIEKTPVLGGMPVRFEELFPHMECGPCLLEPVIAEVLHGKHSPRIEVLLGAEVAGITGSFGNFNLTIRQTPRGADARTCIGCSECIAVCPAQRPNEFDCNLSLGKAIDFAFPGALPNVPRLDPGACKRALAGGCTACRDACPLPGTISFDLTPQLVKRRAGAVIVATGSALYDCSRIPELGYTASPAVVSSLELERILASNGPTGGRLEIPGSGRTPGRVVLVHCAGSLDAAHLPYCSGICCSTAFKLSRLAANKSPETRFTHLYKDLVVSGKEAFHIMDHARHDARLELVRYREIRAVSPAAGGHQIRFATAEGAEGVLDADMVVLCAGLVPNATASALAAQLGVPLDAAGFFAPLQPIAYPGQSKVRGIYLAGACQGPMDIPTASAQGMAGAGYALSSLVEGRMLEVEPVKATADPALCSACHICEPVCPYQAIDYDPATGAARVDDLLCQGCGTCVAACPSGALRAPHFTSGQIEAEIEALLR